MIPREERYPTHTSIILSARGLGRHFTVKNVSKSGAGLEGQKQLRIGERVTLNFRDRHLDGTVRWADTGAVGIAFEERLDDAGLTMLLNPPPPTPRPELRVQ
ncbi:MAG: PilZ domain-containing protein [Pseudomonadota bacterium]